MMKDIIYCLVLERKIGDVNPVECQELDLCMQSGLNVGNTLIGIDSFTSKFTEEEIRNSIKNSNMPRLEFCEYPLMIYCYVKHGENLKRVKRYPVTYKDTIKTINDYAQSALILEINDRNKLYGEFKKIIEKLFTDVSVISKLLNSFKEALKENDKNRLFGIIEEVAESSYSGAREIYFTIYELETKRKQNVSQINEYGEVEILDKERTLRKYEEVA